MWFPIALLGYFLLAVVFVLDKIILTKTTVVKPAVYTFYSTIFLFGALLAWPLGVELLHGIDWWWAIVSGLAFGFGLWTLFAAVKHGEASHINPFNGAVITIATFLFSSAFLNEYLTPMQVGGMVILVVASVFLSFEKTRRQENFRAAFLWAFVSGMLFAISHVSAKYLYDAYPFLTGFVWTRASIGLVGLVTLLLPSVRASFQPKADPPRAEKQDNKKQQIGFAKRHSFFLVVLDKVMAIVAVVFIQYAVAIGSVTLVAAMSGLQYVLMFGLIYFLTRCVPKIFKEYFTRRELMVQTAAIVLVAVGSALFVW